MDLANRRILGDECSVLPAQFRNVVEKHNRTDTITSLDQWDYQEIEYGAPIIKVISS
jgi:hypothetical protein